MLQPLRLFPAPAFLVVTVLTSAALMSAPSAVAETKSTATPLDELRKSFTIDGKPVPPEVFRDMGDGDMADSGAIIVTIDVKAAIGSNLYADDIKVSDDWVSQTKQGQKDSSLTEETAYKFVGTTESKLLVAIASFSGGGSGVFYTLHILDAQAARAFDSEGKLYDRANLTELRSVALGRHGEDQWQHAFDHDDRWRTPRP